MNMIDCNMNIVKSPFRISLFGGSCDYPSFYKKHGCLLIGTTIDKYVYVSFRKRPQIVSDKSIITYSKQEIVNNVENIEHPFIRECLKYFNINCAIDLHTFSDIPSRVGLGGSSSFGVSLVKCLSKLNKKQCANVVNHIEKEILKEHGGVQDSIWASYGNFNSIEINKDGNYSVKPMPLNEDFIQTFENSLTLIYTGEQRKGFEVAKSHDNVDKDRYKGMILDIAKQAYQEFKNENIRNIGKLLHDSWQNKKEISPLISTKNVQEIENKCMELGAYGVKLLGSGGGGFCLVVSDPITKQRINEHFMNKIFKFKFEKNGASNVL